MKLLLDTVTFLDAALASKDLSPRARDLMLDPENDLHVSIVSFWEITIKYSIRKIGLPESPDRFIREHQSNLGAEVVNLDEESIFHLLKLPRLHNDPFDRILICQALVHGMVIVTPDNRIARYPVRTAW